VTNEYLSSRCTERGSGEAIILIHGMGGIHLLEPLSDIMAKSNRVLMPVLPGFYPGDQRFKYSDGYYADFIESVRIQNKLEKVIVAGYSMGGRTALNYSVKYPERVSKIILMDTVGPGSLSSAFNIPLLNRLLPIFLKAFLRKPEVRRKLALAEFVNPDSQIANKTAELFGKMLEDKQILQNWVEILVKIGREKKSWRKELMGLKIKALILWSEKDKTAPVEWAQILSELLTESSVHILENANHAGVIENPDFFAKRIKLFLS